MKKLLLMLVLVGIVMFCAVMFWQFTQTDMVQDFLWSRIPANHSNKRELKASQRKK